MQIFTVEITDDAAVATLHEMEAKHLIKITHEWVSDTTGSPALPGAPMELTAFKEWVEAAENTATVDANEAKQQWTKKRKQLLQAAQ